MCIWDCLFPRSKQEDPITPYPSPKVKNTDAVTFMQMMKEADEIRKKKIAEIARDSLETKK